MKTKKIVAVVLSACLLLGTAVVANADEVQTDETMETISIETEVVDETEAVFETEVISETDAMVEEIEISETDAVVEELPETEPEAEVAEAVPEITEEVQETVAEDTYDYESAEYFTNDGYVDIGCDCSVRVSPDPDAEVICDLQSGTSVHMIAMSWESPWIMVEVNGQTGYLNMYSSHSDSTSEEESEEIFSDYISEVNE